ncbi:MAG: MFS transporter [Acidobacteriota bacterium]
MSQNIEDSQRETVPVDEAVRTVETEIKGGLERYTLVIGMAAFITSIGQMEVIGQLPVRYYLKEHLKIAPEQMSIFFLIAAVAWYLKPLAGLVSDAFPLFGTRRRHYLMLSSAAAGICWLLLGAVPKIYITMLAIAVTLNAMMVIASTVMGGLLVEEAQKLNATGRFSSLREGVNMLAVTIGLPVGGYLAEKAFGWTALVGGGLLFLLSATVFFYLKEEPVARRNTAVWTAARSQLGVLAHSRTLWTACLLIFLFYVAPGFATPLYYIQIDQLKFSQVFIGWLSVIGGITGMAGAFAYSKFCKLLPLRTTIIVGIILSGLCTLLYLFFKSEVSALVIVAVNGFFATFGVISLFDLATRSTPSGCEGLGYALMMSLRNFAVSGADWVGSWLMQTHGWSFSSLVFVNAATTLLVLLAVPFLPKALVGRSEDMNGQE